MRADTLHFSGTTRPLGRAPKVIEGNRICAQDGCDTRLSRYNRKQKCRFHQLYKIATLESVPEIVISTPRRERRIQEERELLTVFYCQGSLQTPGDWNLCPVCGKSFAIRADGLIRKHGR